MAAGNVMNIRHVETVKEIVGPEKLSLLTDIFRNSSGTPPALPSARYRADHPRWLDVLDEFANGQLFLQRDTAGKSYTLRVYALPLVDDVHAEELLRLMNSIYAVFKTLYQEHLSERIPVSSITTLVHADINLTRKALFYMRDAHGIWSCLTNGFPYENDAGICISETVLRKDDFGSVLSEFYEWHYINAKNRALSKDANPALSTLNLDSRGFLRDSGESTEPDWYRVLDDTKKALIKELDVAARNGLVALPTMGLRTLIESVMREKIGDKDSFGAALRAFRDAGYVTARHAELIDKVIEAGHASIHRTHFPDESDVDVCIDVVRHLLEGVYVLKPKVDVVAEKTPKRV